MTDVTETITQLLDRFTRPDASAATLLCDGHDPDADAFWFVDQELNRSVLTYGELASRSRRMASVLADFGVSAGDRVAVLMGKSESLVVILLAIWRLGAVHVPLFTAFAAPAIRLRVVRSGAALLIADPSQSEKISSLPDVQVVTVAEVEARAATSPSFDGVPQGGPDTELVRLFTSGTTGDPKAVAIPVRALASFASYLHFGLDVQSDDVLWNAADPGWAYGLYYGVLGPLAAGHMNLLLGAPFSASLTLAAIQKFGVSNFAAAPTVYRAMRAVADAPSLAVRRASSAGEPLTPDVPRWSIDAWGVEVRDHYGQTEQGMVIANGWHESVLAPVRPGSMGRALPGFTVGVIDGSIAVDAEESPLAWFTGYVDDPDRTRERYTADGRWYLTGDVGTIDSDGYVAFTSRDDDVIIMAGYRIGPFEVESVLATHPAVAEAAVVGAPDELRGEVVVAFVVLAAGAEAGSALVADLQEHVKRNFAAHAYPRDVFFVAELPKTPSGKVQRFLLRESLA